MSKIKIFRLFFIIVSLFVTTVIYAQTMTENDPTIAERLGYSKDSKLLIIHCDDLGMAHSITSHPPPGRMIS